MEYIVLLISMLPAMIANMVPVVAEKLHILPRLAFPVDKGATFRGKRIFGDHKTLRGFVTGIISGTVTAMLLFYLPISFGWQSIFIAMLWGFLISTGALAGDAVKSFFKRQLGIASGGPFIPFDQIDYIVGAVALSALAFSWDINHVIFLTLFALIANPIVNLLSYALGIKKTFY